MRVAVVGGGVAGLSLAWALARRGARPLVLEASEDGAGGASTVPVALLNPYRGRAGRAHPDDLRGLAATLRWADELRARGLETGVHRSGVLRIPPDARTARAWRARALADGPGAAAWLGAEAVPAPYRAPHGALRVSGGAWLETPAWRRALAAATRADGGEVRTGTRVEAVREDGAGVRLVGVPGPDGDALTVDAAALCVGADPAPHPRAPELERVEGDVVTLAGAPPLPLPLAGGVYATSEAARADRAEGSPATATACVGGHHRRPGTADGGEAERLRAALARTVPDVDRARIAAVWHGVRGKGPDVRPIVTTLGARVHYLGALSGRGYLCAAALAEDLAPLIAPDPRPPAS